MFEPDPLLARAHLNQLCREDFGAFSMRAFRELHDEPYEHNWHVEAIATALTRLANAGTRRLILTMPPRTMKSFLASVCLPAWLLGRDPAEKIICASYAQPLSQDFAFMMRRLMQSKWYKGVFPATHIDPKKSGLDEIKTTRGGYRVSTSAGGTLTGRGANFIIIDDPIKAADAHSETIRESVIQWYNTTVTSRLNNQNTGKILVVAQRLHHEDLPGHLLNTGAWTQLELPLIAWKNQIIEVKPGQPMLRMAGEVLQKSRFPDVAIQELRCAMGERDFEAQYNQRPTPDGGAIFRLEWIKRYKAPPTPAQTQGIFQSWDTAYETNKSNDYSVCTTWALSGTHCFLLDVYRARLTFPELQKAVFAQRDKWKADLVIVEAIGSGLSLFQNIRDPSVRPWIVNMRPDGSKQERASKQSPKFERGEVWLPTQAPWLEIFEDELVYFPQGKYDDQVDSAVQFLASLDTGNLLYRADTARRRC